MSGNERGYARPVAVTGYGSWTNLNASLRSLQFYDARGARSSNGLTFWGGRPG